jgi:hypothetical protein
MRPRWLVLVLEGGKYNPRVRELTHARSGAYAIRERDSHRVMYVGESSCGKLWKTMLRHFQAPDSFAKVRETGVFRKGPEHYEVAIWPTSKGVRRCTRQGAGKNQPGDPKALAAQAKWIASLKPEKNKDDGLAFDADEWRRERERLAAGEDTWGGLLNPAGTLTNMGALTVLQGRDLKTGRARVMRWPLRSAPTLAFDDAGRLFIVYRGRVVRPTTAEETAKFRRAHWGKEGRREVTEGVVAVPPFRRVMVGESITYTTEKGADRELVDYVHPWGEGAKGRWLPPIVVEHECHPATCPGSKCAARNMLALMGGTYTTESRGIVG